MALYLFRCQACGNEDEALLSELVETLTCSKCRGISKRQVTSPAVVKVLGSWNSPRGRWMRDWTPQSPPFHTGSQHGEKY